MFTATEKKLLESTYKNVPGVLCMDQGNPGPNVAVFSVTHGNEISGFAALVSLLEDPKFLEKKIYGKLFFIAHNLEAYKAFRKTEKERVVGPTEFRFLDFNLNRIFTEEQLQNTNSVVREAKRAQEIVTLIPEFDYVLDLHSTSMPSDPMLIAFSGGEDEEVGNALGIEKHIVDIFDKIPGESLSGYVKKHGRRGKETVSMAVEAGSHFDDEAVPYARDTVLRFLGAVGSVHTDDLVEPKTVAVSRYMVKTNLLPQSDNFHWTHPWVGFQPVTKGTVLAKEDGKDIITDDDYILLMPTALPKKGGDGVYLTKLVV